MELVVHGQKLFIHCHQLFRLYVVAVVMPGVAITLAVLYPVPHIIGGILVVYILVLNLDIVPVIHGIVVL
jgi:hypothetical protein